jgi:hypothetical protein
MSDIFTLDTEGQKALATEAAMNPLDLSQVNAGFFKGTGKGIGLGFMRGGAETADTVQTLGRFFDEPGTDQQATDELAADIHHDSVDYWTPRPAEVGKAGQVLGGLSEIALPLMAGGGNPSLLVATETNKTGKQLVDQGVDAKTAGEIAALQGVATYAGFKLPFLGNSLTTRMASGAFGNLVLNGGVTAAEQQILKANGQDQVAEQFNPFDLEARTVDVLTGLAFGGIAHLQMRPSDRAAIATANNAKHFQHDTAPGVPADLESSIAHQRAMEQATEQLLRGDPVSVAPEIADASFVRAVRPEPIPVDDPHVAQLEPDQQNTIREMYRVAEENKPHFDEQLNEIAKEVDGETLLAPLKSTMRAVEKSVADYGGQVSKLKDLVRGTVVLKDLSSAELSIESARAKFGELQGLRNGLDPASPDTSPDGYRDIKFNVRVNGHTAEVQINVPEMLRAKEKAHPIYEEAQKVERKWLGENRDPTPEEWKQYQKLRSQQRAIYDAAWSKAVTKARNSDSETSTPLRSNDVAGNRRGSAESQARQMPSGESDTGTPSTSANSVPAGKESGSTTSPPGESIAQGEARIVNAGSFDITTVQNLLKLRDIQVPTGEMDAEGNPVTTSARELMAKMDKQVKQAEHDSNAFEAAARCFLEG